MTRYFMRDTPLCQMEQQMMTPPYFKPRGHGRYYPGFQYSRDDMECQYCMNFRRKHPCPLEQCVCLDERIVAGAIGTPGREEMVVRFLFVFVRSRCQQGPING